MIGHCLNCAYWKGAHTTVLGACTKRAPVGVTKRAPGTTDSMILVTEWPQTRAGDGCGDFMDEPAST